jgi:hypothetical protein
MPLDTPLEFIDTRDIAIAIANALFSNDVWNNTYNLGGGKDCRITYREHLDDLFEIMGCGKDLIPEDKFKKDGYYIGYCDTSEIQELLQFQHHDIDDYYEVAKKWIGIKRYLIPLVKPFVRWYLLWKLKKSKIKEKYRQSQKQLKETRRRFYKQEKVRI